MPKHEVVLQMMGLDAFLSTSPFSPGATTYTRTSLDFDPAKYDDILEMYWEIEVINGNSVDIDVKLVYGVETKIFTVPPTGSLDADSIPMSQLIDAPVSPVTFQLRLDDIPVDGSITVSLSNIVIVQGMNATKTRLQHIFTRSSFQQELDVDALASSVDLSADEANFSFGGSFFTSADELEDVDSEVNFFLYEASKWDEVVGFSYEGIIGAAAETGSAFVEMVLADADTRTQVSGIARLDVENTDEHGELLYFKLPVLKEDLVDGKSYATMNRRTLATSGFTAAWIVRQELYIELQNLEKYQTWFDVNTQFFGSGQSILHRYGRTVDITRYSDFDSVGFFAQGALWQGTSAVWEAVLTEEEIDEVSVEIGDVATGGFGIVSVSFTPGSFQYNSRNALISGSGGSIDQRYRRIVFTFVSIADALSAKAVVSRLDDVIQGTINISTLSTDWQTVLNTTGEGSLEELLGMVSQFPHITGENVEFEVTVDGGTPSTLVGKRMTTTAKYVQSLLVRVRRTS